MIMLWEKKLEEYLKYEGKIIKSISTEPVFLEKIIHDKTVK